MKKLIFILALSLINVPTGSNYSAIHPINDFKIVTSHAYAKNNEGKSKIIEFDKEITLIEYLKGAWYFNEIVETKDSEGYTYMKPLLDQNGNTVRIKNNDVDFDKKVRSTWLSPTLHLAIKGRKAVKFLMGIANLDYKKNDIACVFKIRSSNDKYSINHLLTVRKDFFDSSIRHKSLIFIDDHFNFEELQITNNAIVVEKRLAINPDSKEATDYPYFQILVGGSNCIWGYIYANLNNSKFMFNRFEKTREFLKLKNNIVVLSLSDLCDMLRAKLDFSSLSDINISYINLKPYINAKEISINMKIGSREVSINAEKSGLSLEPYYEESHLWMSLVDACRIFNLRYYWREIDNSVLIELFSYTY